MLHAYFHLEWYELLFFRLLNVTVSQVCQHDEALGNIGQIKRVRHIGLSE